jgi:hypothetical protein
MISTEKAKNKVLDDWVVLKNNIPTTEGFMEAMIYHLLDCIEISG